VEVVVRATIYSPPNPRTRPCRGAVWLDGDRIEETCWENIQAILERTGSARRTWIGVWWESREYKYDDGEQFLFPWEQSGVVSCEFQIDDGYDGVSVRLSVAADVIPLVCQTAVALGGGVGQGLANG
jgi:hypothetical protein